MKTSNGYTIRVLVCFLTAFMLACQSEPDPGNGSSGGLSDEEILALGISKEDAIKKLSHAPTGVVYVETPNQTVEFDFDFDWDETFFWVFDIQSGCDIWNTIQTVGDLVSLYKRRYPMFHRMYSSYPSVPCNDDVVYPKMEYLLAQECFRDDCSSMTRKAVLEMVIERQSLKFAEYNLFTFKHISVEMGIFLMAVILAKEKAADFITAIHEHADLQDAMHLTLHYDSNFLLYEEELSEFVRQYAIRFLSDE